MASTEPGPIKPLPGGSLGFTEKCYQVLNHAQSCLSIGERPDYLRVDGTQRYAAVHHRYYAALGQFDPRRSALTAPAAQHRMWPQRVRAEPPTINPRVSDERAALRTSRKAPCARDEFEVELGWKFATRCSAAQQLAHDLPAARLEVVAQQARDVSVGLPFRHDAREREPCGGFALELVGTPNQHSSEVGPDTPVAPLVGIGQRRAAHCLTQSHRVERWSIGTRWG